MGDWRVRVEWVELMEEDVKREREVMHGNADERDEVRVEMSMWQEWMLAGCVETFYPFSFTWFNECYRN